MSDGEYGTADNMIQQILDIETRTEYPEFDTDMKHIREAHTIVRCFLCSEDCERGAIVKNNNGQFAKIKVVGIGGAGGNAVARMIQAGLGNVEFVVMNTDAQVLEKMQSDDKLQLGATLTKGLGAGADPQVGRKAAEEDKQEIARVLEGADMVFITAGLGGGTGTGAAPVVAEIAREMGALTVGVVTKPFGFEGRRRMKTAEEGTAELREKVDSLITIPNDKLLSVVDQKTTILEAFRVADDVLRQGVQGISDLITEAGLINLDFADVKAVMSNSGSALMGIGISEGENRAAEAAQHAISSPLLEEKIDGAKGLVINITGGLDLRLHEVNEAAGIISDAADNEANIIFGAVIDPELEGEVRVTVLATGFGGKMDRRFAVDDAQAKVLSGDDLDIPAFLRQK
jgi:cell division protein FtsZ